MFVRLTELSPELNDSRGIVQFHNGRKVTMQSSAVDLFIYVGQDYLNINFKLEVPIYTVLSYEFGENFYLQASCLVRGEQNDS